MNGYNEKNGTVMVPLDINNEILRPLERLEDKFDILDDKMNGHLKAHKEFEAKEEVRRDRNKKALIWTASASAPVLIALIAHFMGVAI